MKRSPQIPVAVFLTSFHPGGTERQITELIGRLDRSRFDVHVACFHREGAWLPRVEAVAPVTAFPISGFARPWTLARAAEFARWCRSRRIAVLQACDLYSNTFALPAAAVAGVPVRIGSRRELNPDKKAVQIALQRQAYRCAHFVVANSRAAAQQLEAEGVPHQRIRIVSNGISLQRFTPRLAGRPITKIISVANLRKEKAHEVLIEALAQLTPRLPLHAVIVGDGPRRLELEAFATARGIADRVTFLGHREDVPELLQQSDVFVLTSRSEAFPNSAMEAMAAGLPVIASRVGGLVDLVEHDRTGILIPPDDPASLASALAALAQSPARAIEIGTAAREAIAQRYSFETMVRAFETLYLGHLDAARTAASHRAAAA